MVRYKNWSEYEFKSSQSPKANFERPSERLNYFSVHSTVPAQMQVVFFKTPKHQEHRPKTFFICILMWVKLSLQFFQTLSFGVPELHHHGLLALVREPITCPWFSTASYKKIKHRTLPNLIFHTHVNLCLKLLKMINCSVSFSTLWPKVICSTTFAVKWTMEHVSRGKQTIGIVPW